jgi:hypothetical protein
MHNFRINIFIMPPPKKGKQQVTGTHCSILLRYFHLKQKKDQVIPINGRREHKQQLHDCVVVSGETRSIKRKPKVCIVAKHESFGDNLIYCAERYAEFKVEGEADGFFTKQKTDLPIFANAPTFFS